MSSSHRPSPSPEPRNWLADVGRLAAHAAHDVRNRLLPLQLQLHLLHDRLAQQPENQQIVERIEQGLIEVEASLNDVAHFTAPGKPKITAVLVRGLIEEVLADQFDGPTDSAAHGLRLEIDVPSDHVVWADRSLLRRAAANLVSNACEATPTGGRLTVTSCWSRSGWELEVADSGPNLDYDEPGCRAIPAAADHGVRRAVVEQIAWLHAGELFALNCPEGGVAWTLRLPQTAAAPESVRRAA